MTPCLKAYDELNSNIIFFHMLNSKIVPRLAGAVLISSKLSLALSEFDVVIVVGRGGRPLKSLLKLKLIFSCWYERE